jgi:hypothetical protein
MGFSLMMVSLNVEVLYGLPNTVISRRANFIVRFGCYVGMDTNTIIAQIDAEISRLQQAKAILSVVTDSTALAPKRLVVRPKKLATVAAIVSVKKTGGMSAEGKARIAAAQKARWAKVRRTAEKAIKSSAAKS